MPQKVMEVRIKDQFGVVLSLPCCPDDTVDSLRTNYCQRIADDPRMVELFWLKRYLVPAASLEACNIRHGDLLFANRYQAAIKAHQQEPVQLLPPPPPPSASAQSSQPANHAGTAAGCSDEADEELVPSTKRRRGATGRLPAAAASSSNSTCCAGLEGSTDAVGGRGPSMQPPAAAPAAAAAAPVIAASPAPQSSTAVAAAAAAPVAAVPPAAAAGGGVPSQAPWPPRPAVAPSQRLLPSAAVPTGLGPGAATAGAAAAGAYSSAAGVAGALGVAPLGTILVYIADEQQDTLTFSTLADTPLSEVARVYSQCCDAMPASMRFLHRCQALQPDATADQLHLLTGAKTLELSLDCYSLTSQLGQLMESCLAGATAQLQALLDAGARAAAATAAGLTPLHLAAAHGHLQCAQLLLDRGAAVNAATRTTATPLYYAVEYGHVPMADLLLQRGAHSCDLHPLHVPGSSSGGGGTSSSSSSTPGDPGGTSSSVLSSFLPSSSAGATSSQRGSGGSGKSRAGAATGLLAGITGSSSSSSSSSGLPGAGSSSNISVNNGSLVVTPGCCQLCAAAAPSATPYSALAHAAMKGDTGMVQLLLPKCVHFQGTTPRLLSMFERVVLLHERQYMAVKEQLSFVDSLLLEISKRTKALKSAGRQKKGGGKGKGSRSSSKRGNSRGPGSPADSSAEGAAVPGSDAAEGGSINNSTDSSQAAGGSSSSSSGNGGVLDVGAVAPLLKDLCDTTLSAARHKEAQGQLLGLAQQQQDVRQLEELIHALKEVYVTWLRESVEKLEQQDRDFAKFRGLLPQQAAWTAVHHAAYAGKEELLGLLLQADSAFAARQAALVKVHRKLYSDWSRKRWGVTGGHNALYNPERALKEANEVLERMAKQVGELPLVLAAFGNHLGAVKLLLDAGVPIDGQDHCSYSALHAAAEHSHVEVVRLLLERGADVSLPNQYASSALHRAAAMGHTGIVELLLDAGADINAVAERPPPVDPAKLAAVAGLDAASLGTSSSSSSSSRGGADGGRGNSGAPAAAAGNGSSANLAASAGAGAAAGGSTAAGLGAAGGSSGSRSWVGQNPAAPVAPGGRRGLALVRTKCRHVLADKPGGKSGFSSGLPTIKSLSVLAAAAEAGHLELAELLLQRGARFDLLCLDDQDTLHAVLDQGYSDIFQLLMQHGRSQVAGRAASAAGSTGTAPGSAHSSSSAAASAHSIGCGSGGVGATATGSAGNGHQPAAQRGTGGGPGSSCSVSSEGSSGKANKAAAGSSSQAAAAAAGSNSSKAVSKKPPRKGTPPPPSSSADSGRSSSTAHPSSSPAAAAGAGSQHTGAAPQQVEEAVHAGAALKQLIAKERAQLRQAKGLSPTPGTTAAASADAAATPGSSTAVGPGDGSREQVVWPREHCCLRHGSLPTGRVCQVTPVPAAAAVPAAVSADPAAAAAGGPFGRLLWPFQDQVVVCCSGGCSLGYHRACWQVAAAELGLPCCPQAGSAAAAHECGSSCTQCTAAAGAPPGAAPPTGPSVLSGAAGSLLGAQQLAPPAINRPTAAIAARSQQGQEEDASCASGAAATSSLGTCPCSSAGLARNQVMGSECNSSSIFAPSTCCSSLACDIAVGRACSSSGAVGAPPSNSAGSNSATYACPTPGCEGIVTTIQYIPAGPVEASCTGTASPTPAAAVVYTAPVEALQHHQQQMQQLKQQRRTARRLQQLLLRRGGSSSSSAACSHRLLSKAGLCSCVLCNSSSRCRRSGSKLPTTGSTNAAAVADATTQIGSSGAADAGQGGSQQQQQSRRLGKAGRRRQHVRAVKLAAAAAAAAADIAAAAVRNVIAAADAEAAAAVVEAEAAAAAVAEAEAAAAAAAAAAATALLKDSGNASVVGSATTRAPAGAEQPSGSAAASGSNGAICEAVADAGALSAWSVAGAAAAAAGGPSAAAAAATSSDCSSTKGKACLARSNSRRSSSDAGCVAADSAKAAAAVCNSTPAGKGKQAPGSNHGPLPSPAAAAGAATTSKVQIKVISVAKKAASLAPPLQSASGELGTGAGADAADGSSLPGQRAVKTAPPPTAVAAAAPNAWTKMKQQPGQQRPAAAAASKPASNGTAAKPAGSSSSSGSKPSRRSKQAGTAAATAAAGGVASEDTGIKGSHADDSAEDVSWQELSQLIDACRLPDTLDSTSQQQQLGSSHCSDLLASSCVVGSASSSSMAAAAAGSGPPGSSGCISSQQVQASASAHMASVSAGPMAAAAAAAATSFPSAPTPVVEAGQGTTAGSAEYGRSSSLALDELLGTHPFGHSLPPHPGFASGLDAGSALLLLGPGSSSSAAGKYTGTCISCCPSPLVTAALAEAARSDAGYGGLSTPAAPVVGECSGSVGGDDAVPFEQQGALASANGTAGSRYSSALASAAAASAAADPSVGSAAHLSMPSALAAAAATAWADSSGAPVATAAAGGSFGAAAGAAAAVPGMEFRQGSLRSAGSAGAGHGVWGAAAWGEIGCGMNQQLPPATARPGAAAISADGAAAGFDSREPWGSASSGGGVGPMPSGLPAWPEAAAAGWSGQGLGATLGDSQWSGVFQQQQHQMLGAWQQVWEGGGTAGVVGTQGLGGDDVLVGRYELLQSGSAACLLPADLHI